MSYLVENPEDRFSRDEAQINCYTVPPLAALDQSWPALMLRPPPYERSCQFSAVKEYYQVLELTPNARFFSKRFFAYHHAVNHPHTNIILSFISFSPKMCHKNFENRFTNKHLTSKNVFEYRFLHGEIISRGSHYFPGKKIKVLKFY